MKLKNLRITVSSVNTSPNKTDFEVIETSVNRVRLEDGSVGRDIESYSLHCLARKGDILKVKVGKQLASKVTEITDALNHDKTVMVTFTGLNITAYAMASNNPQYPINSGVTAKAEDFTFNINTEDDIDIEL
jgi:hypothetical protein